MTRFGLLYSLLSPPEQPTTLALPDGKLLASRVMLFGFRMVGLVPSVSLTGFSFRHSE